MSQRTSAGLAAVCLLILVWAAAAFTPLPYVTYSPGPTVDLLASADDGEPKIQVIGRPAYRDEGELRLTTIYVDDPEKRVNLFSVLRAYFDPDEAVYPRSAIYSPEETDESSSRQNAVQMISSQDTAVAAALTELGYEVGEVIEVLDVSAGMPAEGKLKVRDQLVEIGGREISETQDVIDAVDAAPVGEPLEFVVRRDGDLRTIEVTPREVDGDKRVGISPGPGFSFPFEVEVNIGDNIGGPSAGLMMALAVYDTLTRGSMTDGNSVAGTGTVTRAGEVGPIGGIQQKIAAARDAGSELFLVPTDNCDAVSGVDHGDMRLVKATDMHDAVTSIEAWAVDPDATLPSCEEKTS